MKFLKRKIISLGIITLGIVLAYTHQDGWGLCLLSVLILECVNQGY